MPYLTPSHYANTLLHDLGRNATLNTLSDRREESRLWAASGAQFLTGAPNSQTQRAPAPLATCAQGAWLALSEQSDGALEPSFEAHKLLGERAAVSHLQRQGAISPGGGCHLLECLDGQIAVTLARPEDWDLLPAWLEHPASCWDDLACIAAQQPATIMAERARMLGLAAAVSLPPTHCTTWFSGQRVASPAPRTHSLPLVLDLSALWAGPLCTQLLAEIGARVIKVESTGRPDGARAGPSSFFDLLNSAKESVALNLATRQGKQQLQQLLARADIVIESNRPRALEQMGITAESIVQQKKGSVWLSITGYGRSLPMRNWIAYGDDAGVAAGLSWLLRQSSGSNTFCSDAIADPLSGLHAALLAWVAWTQGGGLLLDLSLSGVITKCIASGQHYGSGLDGKAAEAMPPTARKAPAKAAVLGSHTREVLSDFGIKH